MSPPPVASIPPPVALTFPVHLLLTWLALSPLLAGNAYFILLAFLSSPPRLSSSRLAGVVRAVGRSPAVGLGDLRK